MKKFTLGFLFISATFFSVAQNLNINNQNIQSIDSLFRVTFKPSEPGAIVLLAKNGKLIYGYANYVKINSSVDIDRIRSN